MSTRFRRGILWTLLAMIALVAILFAYGFKVNSTAEEPVV